MPSFGKYGADLYFIGVVNDLPEIFRKGIPEIFTHMPGYPFRKVKTLRTECGRIVFIDGLLDDIPSAEEKRKYVHVILEIQDDPYTYRVLDLRSRLSACIFDLDLVSDRIDGLYP